MGEPHQVGVGRRRVDHHELVGVLHLANGLGEGAELHRLVVADVFRRATLEREVDGQFDIPGGGIRPRPAILEETRQRLLARVEIDRGNAKAGLHERHRQVDRHRRLARAALLVTDDDDVSRPEIRRLYIVEVHVGRSGH